MIEMLMNNRYLDQHQLIIKNRFQIINQFKAIRKQVNLVVANTIRIQVNMQVSKKWMVKLKVFRKNHQSCNIKMLNSLEDLPINKKE